MKPSSALIPYLVLSGFLLISSQPSHSTSLPKSTMEMLKRNKLDPAILGDIDKELQVPQEWIERAKKEGKLRVRGTSDAGLRANVTYAAFKERYPFIDLEVSGTSAEDRVVKTLIAYKRGTVIGDVVESVSKYLKSYKEANALEDVRSIPGLQNVIPEARDPEGLWVPHSANTYCMAYNTKLVQVKDLPHNWEDLLVNPAWKKGNLALPNRPENWVQSLWKAKGESWTKEFLVNLFAETKPQRRKEGQNAMFQLLAAGEFQAVIPASNSGTHKATLEGAPINFWCPEPAPFLISTTVAIKGPNVHAAKIYLNWVLSKEGQIAREIDTAGTSIHNQLQGKEFFPFAERIVGKRRVFTNVSDEERLMPELTQFWSDLWVKR